MLAYWINVLLIDTFRFLWHDTPKRRVILVREVR